MLGVNRERSTNPLRPRVSHISTVRTVRGAAGHLLTYCKAEQAGRQRDLLSARMVGRSPLTNYKASISGVHTAKGDIEGAELTACNAEWAGRHRDPRGKKWGGRDIYVLPISPRGVNTSGSQTKG